MDFFVWCSVVVLVYCTNKIEELKDRIIRRKHKIEWQQRVFLWCGGWVCVAAITRTETKTQDKPAQNVLLGQKFNTTDSEI
jgi:hypothetical protein